MEKRWQGVAYTYYLFWFQDAHVVPVVCLLGVLLIARPLFIFGSDDHPNEKDLGAVIENGVTAEQRMAAVWCVFPLLSIKFWAHPGYSVSLIGVIGSAGACKSKFLSFKWSYKLTALLSHFNPGNRKACSSPP
jgi:hypothetical protein